MSRIAFHKCSRSFIICVLIGLNVLGEDKILADIRAASLEATLFAKIIVKNP